MKTPDMSAFVGMNFDCEFKQILLFGQRMDNEHHYWCVGLLDKVPENPHRKYVGEKGLLDSKHCRPRMGKEQVLTPEEISKLPDGFAWRVRYLNVDSCEYHEETLTTEELHQMLMMGHVLEWVDCRGVKAGKGYEEWAEANGMPVINLSGGGE